MASPEYSFLSSSGIKELATFGANIDDLVPTTSRRLCTIACRGTASRTLFDGKDVIFNGLEAFSWTFSY